MAVLALVLVVGCLLALAVLTGIGANRRGTSRWATAFAAVFFPITWTVWYVKDEHPYARRRRTA